MATDGSNLFVPGYIHWDMNKLPSSGSKAVGYANCQFRGAQTMCGPRGLPGEADHLFHNNGNGTFTDVSQKAGVEDKRRYYGFSSTFVDIDDDGKVDLIVTDDSSPNYLYTNKGDGTFQDSSFYSGFALNQDARETASMGLAVGGYRNNGRLDLYTTTFSDDYKTLYRNDGDGNFVDITPQMSIAELTYPFLSWGTAFFDYDYDGWKDLMFVSGHVYPQVDQHNWGTSFAERPLLFHNVNHGQKFEVIPPVEGSGLADVIPARGAAFGDLFNDGKIDVVINCLDHTPVLLRNVVENHNNWVGFPSHITGHCYHASPLQQDWIRRAGWCLVECPECGAAPGVRCGGFSARRRKRPLIGVHPQRRDAASANGYGGIGWHTFRHKYETLLRGPRLRSTCSRS